MSGSAPTLALRLRDSRGLRAYLLALHAAAGAALLCLPAPIALRVLLAATLLAASLGLRRHGRAPLRYIALGGDGECLTVDARGGCVRGALGRGSLALPGLVMLALREATGARRYCGVPSDALATDDWRRLRVRVRFVA